jgi:pimeloyl-ACP methyl ester carboxylesterase
MGAALALRLAVTHPHLARALILIRPAWIAEPAPPNLAPVREAASLLQRLPPEDARGAFLASDTARRLAKESPDNLASLNGYFDQPREGRADLLAAIATDHPGVTEAQIAALRLPTLVLGTSDDTIHPLAMAKRLADLIPGARFTELPSKSRTRPAHFAALHAAISTFLKDL